MASPRVGSTCSVVEDSGGGRTTVRFRVPDMDCAGCVATLREHLSGVEGVRSVEGSPVQRTLTVEVDASRIEAETVRREIERLGYSPQPEGGQSLRLRADTWRSRQARIAYASAGMFALAWAVRLTRADAAPTSSPLLGLQVSDALFLLSALVGGWNFFPKGLRAARAFALDMNFLMTVAILGAIGIGQHAEAAAIAFLFALAELLESYAVDRARTSVEALMRLAPETARVLRDGVEVLVSAAEVARSDVVVVRPGDRIPNDGIVLEGTSAVDQSPVTGESMPVEKGPGSHVFSGTINREGFMTVLVEQEARDSMLARIVRLVEEAELRKTETERFVERFARRYTPAVTLAAILIVLVPVLVFGAPFTMWFVRGLTLLVIACPCALVISTPVAVVSGITAAARHGVLIKGGTYLEALGGVRAVAFDKTGTLTTGHPVVAEVRPAPGVRIADLIGRAAAVESRSEHPLARAVVDYASESGTPAGFVVSDFRAVPGQGAVARVDGIEHKVGKASFAAPEIAVPGGLSSGGRTVLAVAAEGRLLGWIAITDRVRPGAAEVVRRLKAEGVRRVVMLTGDASGPAEAIGRETLVDEVHAGLLPQDKVEAVKGLEARYGPVAMVGDGVNDAPALAAATVGVVMGAAGSDAALETADIALMGDDLSKLPYVWKLSRAARRIIRTNVAMALAVKAILAIGVPLGAVSLITAVVVGDMGLSLAVTLNALRLARVRP